MSQRSEGAGKAFEVRFKVSDGVAQLQDEAGVDGILAGGAPMDEARGVRVAISAAPVAGWRCVAGWRANSYAPSDETTYWLFVADAVAAAHLKRDLIEFAANDVEHVMSLKLADDRLKSCPADR